MTAIDAEARHEIEMFVSGEQDSEGLDGWWFVTNPPLTGPCMDIWVTLTSMSFFGVTEREARERLSAIYYGPDTAIWHEGNDWDERGGDDEQTTTR